MTENARANRAPGEVRPGLGWSNDGTERLAHQIDHQYIAARAYAIYLSRNGATGSADDDWRLAEAEYVTQRANNLRLG
jgi:hypothetical protein